MVDFKVKEGEVRVESGVFEGELHFTPSGWDPSWAVVKIVEPQVARAFDRRKAAVYAEAAMAMIQKAGR